MIIEPFDISGAESIVPADYIVLTDKGLARLLGANCMNGKVKISVALARSSLAPQAEDAEIDQKRLSDWLPIEGMFKNPHPQCSLCTVDGCSKDTTRLLARVFITVAPSTTVANWLIH